MAMFIKTEGNFSIYELSNNECRQHGREFPTLVCWDKDDHEDIGNMRLTKNETGTLDEIISWCREYSYQR
jgi:hypothetical protein